MIIFMEYLRFCSLICVLAALKFTIVSSGHCHGPPESRGGAKAGLLESEAEIKYEFSKVPYVWNNHMRGMMGKCYTVNYASGNILGLPSPDGSQNGIWYFPISVLCRCYDTTTTAAATTPVPTTPTPTTSPVRDVCPENFESVSGLDPQKCYQLVLPGTGLITTEFFVNFSMARQECASQGGQLIRNSDISNMAATKAYLTGFHAALFNKPDGKFIPNGIWQGYQRQPFPLLNQSYDEVVKPQRTDPKQYFDVYSDDSKLQMPEALWRKDKNPAKTQPNDANGKDPLNIDERCVAMKRINDPKIKGFDDYDCDGGLKAVHAVFCEASRM